MGRASFRILTALLVVITLLPLISADLLMYAQFTPQPISDYSHAEPAEYTVGSHVLGGRSSEGGTTSNTITLYTGISYAHDFGIDRDGEQDISVWMDNFILPECPGMPVSGPYDNFPPDFWGVVPARNGIDAVDDPSHDWNCAVRTPTSSGSQGYWAIASDFIDTVILIADNRWTINVNAQHVSLTPTLSSTIQVVDANTRLRA